MISVCRSAPGVPHVHLRNHLFQTETHVQHRLSPLKHMVLCSITYVKQIGLVFRCSTSPSMNISSETHGFVLHTRVKHMGCVHCDHRVYDSKHEVFLL